MNRGDINEAVWCWCSDCKEWVGSEPPLCPPYWSNRKAMALHKSGSPTHRTRLVGIADALDIVEQNAVVAA